MPGFGKVGLNFLNQLGWKEECQGVRGRGRENTYNLFCTAIENSGANELPLLLVDSEGPIREKHSVWDHLRAQDNWSKPRLANDNQAFLMVQLMETWFLADPENLKNYFGRDFNANRIPAWSNLASVDKATVLTVLNSATNSKYEKGKVSFEILGKINPEKIKEKIPEGARFIKFLQENK